MRGASRRKSLAAAAASRQRRHSRVILAQRRRVSNVSQTDRSAIIEAAIQTGDTDDVRMYLSIQLLISL